MNVRDSVIFADSMRVEHQALVTAVFTPDCINVVYVTGDETRTDQYGRQTVRETSVPRFNEANCFGRTFRAVDSEQPTYREYAQQT